MTIIEAIALLASAVIVPYVVQLIKTEALTGNAARWIAIGVSLLAGVACGLVGGIPDTPGAWLVCIFTAVGAVQAAYTVFSSVGVTSKWLAALLALKIPKDADDPIEVAKNISTEAKAEDAADRKAKDASDEAVD